MLVRRRKMLNLVTDGDHHPNNTKDQKFRNDGDFEIEEGRSPPSPVQRLRVQTTGTDGIHRSINTGSAKA